MNDHIVQYARDNFGMLIGQRTAEDLKIKIGSVYPLAEPLTASMRGRDLVSGLPKEIIVSDTHIREALTPAVKIILDSVKAVIEEIPPEVISDIMHRGIVLAGGGAQLRGLDQLLRDETKMPITIADDPLTCVVRGCGIVVEDLETLREVLLPTDFSRIPR